jgi:hypothetical protein
MVQHHFQQYFSYIGGGNQRKTPTCHNGKLIVIENKKKICLECTDGSAESLLGIFFLPSDRATNFTCL